SPGRLPDRLPMQRGDEHRRQGLRPEELNHSTRKIPRLSRENASRSSSDRISRLLHQREVEMEVVEAVETHRQDLLRKEKVAQVRPGKGAAGVAGAGGIQ